MSASLCSPLAGLRIIEFEGIGPGPLAGLMLADMGAEVTVITRLEPGEVQTQLSGSHDNPLRRGKIVLPLDLKQASAREQVLAMLVKADALIEGNRPGVMERLGLGPADCAGLNPRLVYGRITGWGQNGPLSQAAGHDLNYVALTGLLALSAHRGDRPILPPTVVGDATGALGLAFGMVCALLEVRGSGQGRVVDAAIVDIAAMLGGIAFWIQNNGQLGSDQPSAFHDSPFYDVYRCADGAFITLGALEPKFYALLLHKLGLDDVDATRQYNVGHWPALKARMTQLFLSKPRQHWCELLEGSDACFAPVLSLSEAASHPHNAARGVFKRSSSGALLSTAAPRYSPLTGAPTHDCA
jgi:alpha-methylacyl-CoA racemase